MTTVLTAATNLMTRVRNPNGEGLSTVLPPTYASGKAFAYSILSEAQRYINTVEENYLETIEYETTPYQTCYAIDSDPILGTGGTSPIIAPIAVKIGDLDLIYSPFRQIWSNNFRWFRAIAPAPYTWSRFGRDVLIVWPATTSKLLINIVAVPYIPDMVNDTDLFSVTDDIVPFVMDLAETLALFKLGEYKLAALPLSRLSQRYNRLLGGDAWAHHLGGLE